MLLFKKLIFALPLLASFVFFSSQLAPFLQNPNSILSLDTSILYSLILLLVSLLTSCFFFTIFITLSQDWRIILPVIFLGSLFPLLFLAPPLNFVLTAGFLLSLVISSLQLQKKLSTYLTFQPTNLLTPSIKQTATFLILISSLAFYLSSNLDLQQHGFKLPPSLLDTALKFMPQQESGNLGTEPTIPSIPPEQLEMLEKNPQLLKQYGLDPSILQTVKSQQGKSQKLSTQDLVRPMIESQVQSFIKPFENYIPLLLTVIFFFTLESFVSLLSIFLSPLLWLLFLTLEKSGFTKFETEMREVKKLVV
ncbi:MAG: hypothetical protein Q7S44_00215 [bacterium]|nr:hypothetical protein [bacterium]